MMITAGCGTQAVKSGRRRKDMKSPRSQRQTAKTNIITSLALVQDPDDLKLCLSSSPRPLTPPSSSPGPSTPISYSLGLSGSVPSLGKAKCSSCKFLAAKIKILEETLEMKMHPENHTLESPAILNELYNDKEKLDVE
ncbi:hypothetical protein Tco_0212553 [Tanacetum coccineum]